MHVPETHGHKQDFFYMQVLTLIALHACNDFRHACMHNCKHCYNWTEQSKSATNKKSSLLNMHAMLFQYNNPCYTRYTATEQKYSH